MRTASIVAFMTLLGLPGLPAQPELSGLYRLEPGQLHPSVVDQLPRGGRAADKHKLSFHASVPLEVELVPKARPGEFEVKSRPDIRVRKLILPALLNVRLSYGKSRQRDHRWEVTQGQAGVEMASRTGTTLRLRGHEVLFLDLNHDGAFGGPSDGYTAKDPSRRQWVRPGETLEIRTQRTPYVIAGTKLYFEVDAAGFSVIVTEKEPVYAISKNEDYLQALAYLNEIRAALGFGAVGLDPELSEACEQHSLYCSLNDDLTHFQDPAKPGHTAEGARAGRASVLATSSSMKEGVFSWLTSFWHRIDLIQPGLTAVGMGFVNGYATMDTKSTLRNVPFEPFSWPPDGYSDVPVGWVSGESPSPTDVEPFTMSEAQKYGYPITLTFQHRAIKEVRAKLLEGETELPIFQSSPEKPGNPKRPDNEESILLMSIGPLKPKTKYRVVIDCLYQGKPYHKEWTFTTR